MVDTLGIYNNNTIYNENAFDVNKHIEKGVNFMNYTKMYGDAKENKFSLLTDTSSPTIGSIVEAFQEGNLSIGASARYNEHEQSEQKKNFDSLLSSYTTSYNIFNEALLNLTPSADDLAQRNIMEQDLNEKYAQLSSLANTIQGNLQQLAEAKNSNADKINITTLQLTTKMNALKKQQQKMKLHKYDNDTIDGGLETGALASTSFQLHYLVYLIIFITVFAFILNLAINPNADAMNATYVLGALLAVYAITRWII